MVKEIVTATIADGDIVYSKGVRRGARLMFSVPDRLSVYVKGSLAGDMYERLTLDLMRRCAARAVPVSELRRTSR